MDSNEIDLDDLDKSDISSDWDSSVDEAPPMEVEGTSEPTLIPNGKEQIEEEIRRMESDDEPDAIPRFSFFSLLIVGTEHEIGQEEIEVEEITEKLDTNAMLIRAGLVSHVLEGSYIVDAGLNSKFRFIADLIYRAVEENTVLYRQSLEPIGRIVEVFGQVEHPFYVLRWPKSMEDPHLLKGDVVYLNNTTIHYILPAQLNHVGTDASNVFDEEPNDRERALIECTEDLKEGEVVDETETINYQQEFVIPPDQEHWRSDASVAKVSTNNPFLESPTPKPLFKPNEYSGLDILKSSYFFIVCIK